jgi:hypothetical protein
LPTLSTDNKEGVDGTSNVIAAADFGTEVVKGDVRISQALLKMTTKSLYFVGKSLGAVSVYNDGATIWNKGIGNATAADWTKFGISDALLLFETNPAFGLTYGILDMAGKNPVDLIYNNLHENI